MNKFQILILIAIGLFLLMYGGNSYINCTNYDKIDKRLIELNSAVNGINENVESVKSINSNISDIIHRGRLKVDADVGGEINVSY